MRSALADLLVQRCRSLVWTDRLPSIEGQNMTGAKLFKSTRLPKGGISNRIAKAAVEEILVDDDHAPGSALVTLYWRWAEG